MEPKKNIFTTKVPERVSNIVKGLFLIVIGFPVAFFSIGIVGGLVGVGVSDVSTEGAFSSELLWIVPGGLFLIFFVTGIYTMVKKVRVE